MATKEITQDDLMEFKATLIEELKIFFSKKENAPTTKWLKSHQVQRLLGISAPTLQNLRDKGIIPYSKIGGVLFYSQEELNLIFQKNKRNKK